MRSEEEEKKKNSTHKIAYLPLILNSIGQTKFAEKKCNCFDILANLAELINYPFTYIFHSIKMRTKQFDFDASKIQYT